MLIFYLNNATISMSGKKQLFYRPFLVSASCEKVRTFKFSRLFLDFSAHYCSPLTFDYLHATFHSLCAYTLRPVRCLLGKLYRHSEIFLFVKKIYAFKSKKNLSSTKYILSFGEKPPRKSVFSTWRTFVEAHVSLW